MSFSSIPFMIFFAVVMLTVLFIDGKKESGRAREVFLLAASLFFYGWWDWRLCFLLLFVTGVGYVSARYTHHPWMYAIGILVPLILLGFFKYFHFFLSSVASLLGRTYASLNIILPLGISFYVFQLIGYHVDVHRGSIKAEEDFIRFALFICFFPRLLAGPIIIGSGFLDQLHEHQKTDWKKIEWGLQVFTIGLFKKMVLADHLSVFVNDVFAHPAAFCWKTIVWAILSYTLQIYLDFSGYSDMAIGISKCLGYDIRENFNVPYLSKSLTEFWRRWHISLSTWLKKYIYISLGGNRKGTCRKYLNLMATMLVGGLWHGANWTFIVWGGINGLGLCLDKAINTKNRTINRIRNALGLPLTFCFVALSWVFFRADSVGDAMLILKGVFTFQQGIHQPFAWTFAAVTISAVYMTAVCIRAKRSNSEAAAFYPVVKLNTVAGLTSFLVFAGLVMCLAFTGNNPFLYQNF